MIIYGHRGAMEHAPQNTMASFLEAERQGADGLELDVQLSRDGKPFVFHDFTLDTLTDGTGALSAHTADELRRLTVKPAAVELGPEAETEAENRGEVLENGIPELRQVLERFGKDLFLNVEIKTPFMASLSETGTVFPGRLIESETEMDSGILEANRRYTEIIADQLLRSGMGQNRSLGSSAAPEVLREYRGLIVSSFDPFALSRLHELAPSIPLAFLSMPGIRKNLDGVAEALLGEFLAAWHPHYNQVDEEMIEYQHCKKRLVNVWTVNEADAARSLSDLGADGLITNSPLRIRRALTNNLQDFIGT